MKLKIEHIKLKHIITEATYSDVFNKIKVGDIMTVKTKTDVYKAKVVYRYSDQVVFNYDDKYYLITKNSFNGKSLDTVRLIIDKNGDVIGKVKGPTINDVYNISIIRNGEPITGVKSGDEKNKQKETKRATFFKKRYEDIKNILESFRDGEIMAITTGKLITKGSDKGSLAKNTITEIKLEVVKKTKNNLLLCKLIDLKGFEKDKYSVLNDKKIIIGSKSLRITNEGMFLVIKISDKNSNNYETFKIGNVFSIDNEGLNISDVKKNSSSIDDVADFLNRNPSIKNMIYKKPSLLGKIFGKKATFDSRYLDALLNNKSVNLNYDIGDKIEFIYYGNPIKINKDLDLKKDGKYIGKYDDENTIIIKSSNRKDMLILNIIGRKRNKLVVDIVYKSTKNNKVTEKDLGKAIIDILD